MPVDKPLTIQLLGTPEITWQSRPYTVPRRQTRALLYRLSAELEPISRDHLLLLFWPDRADLQARRNLTRLLSSLRSALPQPDLILSDMSTVTLNQQLAGSDSALFFQLAQREEEKAWEKAAALVGGSFLDGFSFTGSPEFDAWQTGMQTRIEQSYLRLLARLIASKTASEDLAAAIQYANQYLDTDDLAETIHRQLITLYARNGERKAAMHQFEVCMLALERELGVSPLPETRAAFDAAQRGDQSKRQPDPERLPQLRWRTLPSLDLPLIGREHESDQLAAAFKKDGKGGAIFISGEPGIGKSRLMQAAASAQEATILLGYCRQATQSLPYQPLVEALRAAVPLADFGQGVQPIWLAETARLLPELKERFSDLPQTAGAQQAQAHQFEALAQIFFDMAARRSLLLCLDDLQWADETTLSWLQFIAPRLPDSGLCLLATYRSEEAASLAALRMVLQRSGFMADVRIGALSEEAVRMIVDLVSAGTAPVNLSERIYRMTGGNTFFVLESVRDLFEQDLLEKPPQSLPVPASVLETVQGRVGRLDPLAQQLLEAAAILATNLNLDVIQATTGRSDLEVVDGLDELVKRQLLLADGDVFRFQHDLVQTAVAQMLTPWRRRLLHRRAGNALEMVFQQDLESAASQIAYHYEKAQRFKPAARYYEKAAIYAQQVYANHEAVHYYEKALTLSGVTMPGVEKGEEQVGGLIRLYEGLGQVLRRQALYGKAEMAFRSMQENAQQLGDMEAVAQSWLRLGQVQDSEKRYADSLQSALNAKALAADLGMDTSYAYALYAQAWALFRLDELDEALLIAQEAVERSEQLADLDLMAYCQNTLGAIYKYLGYYQLSDQHQYRALSLFEKTGDRRRVAGMINNLGETARLRHDYEQAYDYYQRAVAIAGEIGERDWLVEFLSNLGLSQSKLGKQNEAKNSFRQAIEVAQATNQEEKAAEIARLLEGLERLN